MPPPVDELEEEEEEEEKGLCLGGAAGLDRADMVSTTTQGCMPRCALRIRWCHHIFHGSRWHAAAARRRDQSANLAAAERSGGANQ